MPHNCPPLCKNRDGDGRTLRLPSDIINNIGIVLFRPFEWAFCRAADVSLAAWRLYMFKYNVITLRIILKVTLSVVKYSKASFLWRIELCNKYSVCHCNRCRIKEELLDRHVHYVKVGVYQFKHKTDTLRLLRGILTEQPCCGFDVDLQVVGHVAFVQNFGK